MTCGNEFHYQPEGTTAARCKPCKILFFWRPGKKRRIRHARCIYCERGLSQTTTANLLKTNVNLVGVEPAFEVMV